MKKALIVYGGWDGHTPEQSAAVFEPELKKLGYDVEMRNSLDAYTDDALMQGLDLIVPIWTMGEISKEQWQGLHDTVHAGCGLAGFHGGIIDSFRQNNGYQMMTGGQFVGHPGNTEPTYDVYSVDKNHEITKGIDRFTLPQTEQYYMHVDPGVHVLMSSKIEHGLGDTATYPVGVEMPFCWTRNWGKGKVFVAAWGHTYADFDVPEAKEIVLRGMQWATK
jgi:uncharacterized protein